MEKLWWVQVSELYIFYIWNDNLQSFNREKNEASVPVFYADWTSVSFPFCQRSCLIRRIMTNTLTNTLTNTYVVIFLSVSIFGRGYHSRYQNFEFTGTSWSLTILPKSRYYKERQVDRKKCQAIRRWFVSIRHGRHVLSQCPKERQSPRGNIKKWY